MVAIILCVFFLYLLFESLGAATVSSEAKIRAYQNGEIFYSASNGKLRTVKGDREVVHTMDENGNEMYHYANKVCRYASCSIVSPEMYRKKKVNEFSKNLAKKCGYDIYVGLASTGTHFGCIEKDILNMKDLPVEFAIYDFDDMPCRLEFKIKGYEDKMRVMIYNAFLSNADNGRIYGKIIHKDICDIRCDRCRLEDTEEYQHLKNRYGIKYKMDYINRVHRYYIRHKDDWKYDQSLIK